MLNKKKQDSASPQSGGGGLFSKANPSQFNVDFGFGQFNQQSVTPAAPPFAPDPVVPNQAPQENYAQTAYPSQEAWNPGNAGFNPQMEQGMGQAPTAPSTSYNPQAAPPVEYNSNITPPAWPPTEQPGLLPATDVMSGAGMGQPLMPQQLMTQQPAPFDPSNLSAAPTHNFPPEMVSPQSAPQAYAPPMQGFPAQPSPVQPSPVQPSMESYFPAQPEQSYALENQSVGNPYGPAPNPAIDYNMPAPGQFPVQESTQTYAAQPLDMGQPIVPPQAAPSWDSPLTATPFPEADPYFNALHTVDDFWSHAGPGFDEGPKEVRPILPQDVTGQFLDHVHEQLYPQDIPGAIQAPPQYSGQIQAQPPLNLDTAPVYPTITQGGGFNPMTPTSSPSVMGPGGIPLPPFEADTNLDAVFDQIEQASRIEPSVPSLYDIPSGPAVFAPQSPVAPAANPVPLETVQPQEIQVQDIFSISQNHSLLFVEAKGTYALMAMANQQYITLKLFQQNPKTASANQFHVAAGVLYGQQQLYQVRIGLWEGTVGFDGNTFVLTGEGQVSGF